MTALPEMDRFQMSASDYTHSFGVRVEPGMPQEAAYEFSGLGGPDVAGKIWDTIEKKRAGK